MSATITFNGWGVFLDKVQSLPQILFDEIDGECMDAAGYWEDLAKMSAPKDTGRLSQNISNYRVSLMHYEVVDPIEYAAYREWGTGSLVSVPEEYTDYAIQFKGKGIKRINSRPQPYFFIQQPIVQKYLFDNITKVLNAEH